MSDNAKKALIIVIVIVAVAGAGFSAYTFTKGDQTQVVRRGPKPASGQLWGKAAMMAQDNGTAPANPPAKSGGGEGAATGN